MLKIQNLKKPNKRSGHKLLPGKTFDMRGIVVTNKNKFPVYVDKWTRKIAKKKK